MQAAQSEPANSRRAGELVAIFGLGPALLALAPRWAVSLGILGGGMLAMMLLRADATFAPGGLWGWSRARGALGRVLARAALAGVAMLAFVAWHAPAALFRLPRTRPVAWAAVMILYPISAYAQEVLYRTFFFHRYGRLFPRAGARVAASAALFGWAHIAVNNLVAVGLATIVGLLFSWTYERTRSTALVALEHALYGDVLFTVGLGEIFYSVSRWMS
ncbi:MAG TPA: CPBP family intramembrane glutamic endopeptidase [Polyangia bacterium]|nr:CPBP family intramembrane glutamic endopeptidase [Polyangia bacterium]